MLTGGFGTSLIAMDERTYELIGPDYPGNRAEDVKNPSLGWMMGFMFVVSFLGLFSLVPLRKVIFVVHYYYTGLARFLSLFFTSFSIVTKRKLYLKRREHEIQARE